MGSLAWLCTATAAICCIVTIAVNVVLLGYLDKCRHATTTELANTTTMTNVELRDYMQELQRGHLEQSSAETPTNTKSELRDYAQSVLKQLEEEFRSRPNEMMQLMQELMCLMA